MSLTRPTIRYKCDLTGLEYVWDKWGLNPKKMEDIKQAKMTVPCEVCGKPHTVYIKS